MCFQLTSTTHILIYLPIQLSLLLIPYDDHPSSCTAITSMYEYSQACGIVGGRKNTRRFIILQISILIGVAGCGYKIMSTSAKQQDLEVLVASIHKCFRKMNIDSETIGHSFKYVYKNLVKNPRLQDFFRHLVQLEVKKMYLMRTRNQYSSEQQNKIIQANIKSEVQAIVKQELQKYELYRRQKENTIKHKLYTDQDLYDQQDNKSQFSNTQKILRTAKIQRSFEQKLDLPNDKFGGLRGKAVSRMHDQEPSQKRKHIKKQKTYRKCDCGEKAVQVIEIKSGSASQKNNSIHPEKSVQAIKESITMRQLSFLPKELDLGATQLRKTAKLGHFVYGDKVKTIIDVLQQGSDDQDLLLLIEWQHRSDGSKPQNSMLRLAEYQYYKPLEVKYFLKKQSLGLQHGK